MLRGVIGDAEGWGQAGPASTASLTPSQDSMATGASNLQKECIIYHLIISYHILYYLIYIVRGDGCRLDPPPQAPSPRPRTPWLQGPQSFKRNYTLYHLSIIIWSYSTGRGVLGASRSRLYSPLPFIPGLHGEERLWTSPTCLWLFYQLLCQYNVASPLVTFYLAPLGRD